MLPHERIEKYGWCLGSLKNPFSGRRCLIGSLVEDPDDYRDENGSEGYGYVLIAAKAAYGDRVNQLIAEVRKELDQTSPSKEFYDTAALYRWNDSKAKDAGEVVAMLKRVGL